MPCCSSRKMRTRKADSGRGGAAKCGDDDNVASERAGAPLVANWAARVGLGRGDTGETEEALIPRCLLGMASLWDVKGVRAPRRLGSYFDALARSRERRMLETQFASWPQDIIYYKARLRSPSFRFHSLLMSTYTIPKTQVTSRAAGN
jgi:hypothetical protein